MSEETEKEGTAGTGDLPAILDELRGMSIERLRDLARREQLVELIGKLKIGILTHQEHAILRGLINDIGASIPENYSKTIDGVATEVLPAPEGQQALPAPEPPKRMELPTFDDDDEDEEDWKDER